MKTDVRNSISESLMTRVFLEKTFPISVSTFIFIKAEVVYAMIEVSVYFGIQLFYFKILKILKIFKIQESDVVADFL